MHCEFVQQWYGDKKSPNSFTGKKKLVKFIRVIHRGGGRCARLVRPSGESLNLTITGATKTLKIQGFK